MKTFSLLKNPALLILIVCLSLSGSLRLFAQEKVTLSGFVKDRLSGEALPGSTVFSSDQRSGAMTNAYGYFAMQVPKDSIHLIIRFPGYKILLHSFVTEADSNLTWYLDPKDVELDEIQIQVDRSKLEQKNMSYQMISVDQIRSMPAFLGEFDLIKAIQFLPGIQSGGEGSAGLYVRGGGPDQNLILLDEAPIYNPTHLFGFFSIFNPEAINGVELYKGAFPAQYGGRLSSVVDVTMKEGNYKRFAVSGGIGLISSRLTVEGPLVKDKASFILSGRRTYVDVFTKQLNRAYGDDPGWTEIPDYFFYDLNAKLNYKVGEKDHFYLSGYFGKDHFDYVDGRYVLNFKWGNTTATARWNHLFSQKLFLNTTLLFNNYDYNIDNEYVTHTAQVYSNIKDYTLKADFDYFPAERHFVRFGYQHSYHGLTPRAVNAEIGGSFDLTQDSTLFSHELALYLSDDFKISPRLQVNAGMRLSAFNSGSKTYLNPEPRLGLWYQPGDKVSLKASWSRMAQYLHLVSNSAISLPTDIWYPSTELTQPEIADQIALGSSVALPGIGAEVSLEVFGKKYQNLVEYREGAQVLFSSFLDEDLTYGKGFSYGAELLLERSVGRFTGWLGYTLSKTFRVFDDLNFGEPFPNKYDRRHDLSLVTAWKASKKWQLSLAFVYGSGTAATLPVGRYYIEDLEELNGTVVPDYTARNNFRMPAYHRLDIGANFTPKPDRKRSVWSFNIYNLYNRRNAFFLYFDQVDEDQDGYAEKYQAKKVSLFPIIPSVTYNFNF